MWLLISRFAPHRYIPNHKRSDTIPEDLLLHGTNNFPTDGKVTLRITNKQVCG